MIKTRANSVRYGAALLVLLSIPYSSQSAAAQTKVSIIHAVVGPGEVLLWIAHEQGLFTKQGIDAQILLPA